MRVAQGDVGVGLGTFVRLASEIDVSALPPGGYELQVALYNWKTGERLSAPMDLVTGRSKRHPHTASLPAQLNN